MLSGRQPAPPPERRRRSRRRRSRPGIWLYLLAAIGLVSVLFLLIRFLIIPLLVAVA